MSNNSKILTVSRREDGKVFIKKNTDGDKPKEEVPPTKLIIYIPWICVIVGIILIVLAIRFFSPILFGVLLFVGVVLFAIAIYNFISSRHIVIVETKRDKANRMIQILVLLVGIAMIVCGILMYYNIIPIIEPYKAIFLVLLLLGAVFVVMAADNIFREHKSDKLARLSADLNFKPSGKWLIFVIAGIVLLVLAILIGTNVIPMPLVITAEASSNQLWFAIIFAIVGAALAIIALIPIIRMPKVTSKSTKPAKQKVDAILRNHYMIRAINDSKQWYIQKMDHYGYGSFVLLEVGAICIISLFFLIFAYFVYGSIAAMVGFLGFMIGLGILSLSSGIPILGTIIAFWTWFGGADALLSFFQLPATPLTGFFIILMFICTLIGNIIITITFFGYLYIARAYPQLAVSIKAQMQGPAPSKDVTQKSDAMKKPSMIFGLIGFLLAMVPGILSTLEIILPVWASATLLIGGSSIVTAAIMFYAFKPE
jgi:hypothetical protein